MAEAPLLSPALGVEVSLSLIVGVEALFHLVCGVGSLPPSPDTS